MNIGLFFEWKKSVVLSITLICSSNLYALEGYEHRKISNLALNIAIKYHCPANSNDKLPNPNCKEIKRVADKLILNSGEHEKRDFDNDGEVSYGKINELVDYMHYPEQIFENFNKNTNYQTNNVATDPKHLNAHVLNLTEKPFWTISD